MRKYLVLGLVAVGILSGCSNGYDSEMNIKKDGEVQTLIGDTTKAFKKLGWKPSVNIKDLIKEMIDSDNEKASKAAKSRSLT